MEILPLLKWAGGKRWLVARGEPIFPETYRDYYEPFIGSGAVFFSLRPNSGCISDANKELIEFYQAVRERPDLVRRGLARHAEKHSKDYYYEVRSARPLTKFSRAARFLYLNQTCWNGLYRVNRRGEFNVPVGTKKSIVGGLREFEKISAALSKIDIISCDFEAAIDRAGSEDFIFCDPPYTVKHNNNGFIKYNECMFSWTDQVRLRDALVRAAARGAKFMVTNAHHESILDLYTDFSISRRDRASVISGFSHGRGRYQECVIKNY